VQIGSEYAVVGFERTIDPAFNRVIVLDGSCTIRHLAQYDETLEIEHLPATKNYSKVEIRWVNAKSGKNSFHGEVGLKHFEAFVEHLKTGLEERYERNASGLIFCHKERKESVQQQEGLAREVMKWAKPISVLHWGQHRATSEYRDSRWLLFWGVQYLPQFAIAAAIIGQTGRLDHRFLRGEIDAIQESEIAESIYQAISRGNSRNVENGEAGAQLVDLVLPDEHMRNVRPLLEQAMPGVRITELRASYFPKISRSNAAGYIALAERIAALLNGLPRTMVRIGKRRVTAMLGVVANEPAFRNADDYLPNILDTWRSVERSYERAAEPRAPAAGEEQFVALMGSTVER
jgi:hypothetical protein